MAEGGQSPDIAVTTPEKSYYGMEQAAKMRVSLERALLDKGLIRRVPQRVDVKTYDGRDHITRERLVVPPEVNKALKEDPMLAARYGIKDIFADTDNTGQPVIRVASKSFGDTSTKVVEFTAGKDDRFRNHKVGFYDPDVSGSSRHFSWHGDEPTSSGKVWAEIDPVAQKVLGRIKKFPDTFKPTIGTRLSGFASKIMPKK